MDRCWSGPWSCAWPGGHCLDRREARWGRSSPGILGQIMLSLSLVGSVWGMGQHITSSLDMTVKVYTMQTGQMLYSISFTAPFTSVVMDNMETTVYAGTKSGQIHSFSLLYPPRDVCVT